MQHRYTIVLSRPVDLDRFEQDSSEDLCPRHAMGCLGKALDARILWPQDTDASVGNRIRALVPGVANADGWALAQKVSAETSDSDTIFTIDEAAGLPIATYLSGPGSRARLVVFMHNPARPRVRYMFWRYRLHDKVALFITNTPSKRDYLIQHLGVEERRVFCIEEQTDTQFFRPGSQSPGKKRPIIGSGGLEQRDYVSLAEATRNMDVDVRVCAVSPNARVCRDTFPTTLPPNMSARFYDWQELRQLYRDSDIVAISLKEHSYQAGLTTLFEALACRRPVVMTRTEGLVDKFAGDGRIIAVPPGDPAAMRRAIEALLANPEQAERLAQRGWEAVRSMHTLERFVSDLVEKVTDGRWNSDIKHSSAFRKELKTRLPITSG